MDYLNLTGNNYTTLMAEWLSIVVMHTWFADRFLLEVAIIRMLIFFIEIT